MLTRLILLLFLYIPYYSFALPLNKEAKTPESLILQAEKILYSNPDRALKIAQEAYLISKKTKNKTFADSNALISYIYSVKGEHKKAIDYAKKAKEIYEELGNRNPSIKMDNTISREYSMLGFYSNALKLNSNLIRILSTDKKIDDDAILQLSDTYDTRAYIYEQQQIGTDSMIKYNELAYENSIKLKKITRDNINNKIRFANNLANSYLKITEEKDPERDKKAFKILLYARTLENKFPDYRVSAYLAYNYGNYYYTIEKDENAIKEFTKALELAEKTNDIYLKRDCHKMLAALYSFSKNKRKELYHEKFERQLSLTINLIEKKDTNQEVVDIQKTQEISFFKTKKKLFFIICGFFLLLTISLFLGIKNYKKSKKEYTHFQQIIKDLSERKEDLKPVIENTILNSEQKKSSSITDEKEAELLKKIEKFEKSQKFLSKNLSQNLMATMLNTNTTYLSEIINQHKRKNFNQYINELRINYIILKLKDEPKFRQYKISVLAEECGFNSHSAFSTVFNNIVGMTPSVFIKFLSNEQ